MNLFEEYVNFVDSTKEQNTFLRRIIVLFKVIVALSLFHLLFKYLNE